MNWLGEFARRIGMLLHRDRVADELQEEIHLHLDLRRHEQVEAGVAATDAAAAARRRFGNPTLLRERSYTVWGWNWLETLTQDVMYGLRAMLRTPGITLVALLSLALGIGANTAIFSLMDAVMLRSLPVKDPQQLVMLGQGHASGITDSFGVTQLYSYPFYRQLQRQNQVFTDTAAVFSMSSDVHGFVLGRTTAEPIQAQLVSGTYFQTLGVQAAIGRVMSDQDDRIEGGNPIAVVSYGWWQKSLGGDPHILGKTLKIADTTYSIIGVAPPEFFGTTVGEAPDIWLPMSMVKSVPPYFNAYSDNFGEALEVIGRLKPGVSIAQATTNVNLLYQQILRNFRGGVLSQRDKDTLKKAYVPITSVATGLSGLRRQFSAPLMLLLSISGLVLLIACANIANLLLARSTVRSREFAVRQALGAQRSRLIRQLLTESLLVATAGGALGLAFAAGASRLLLRMISSGPEVLPLRVSVDGQMLLFTLAVTVTTALLFGTIPAFRATKLELTKSLKEGQGAVRVHGKSLLAKSLIVSQVTFSLLLVVAAGLFLRSLVNLNRVDTGFQRDGVLRVALDSTSMGFKVDDPRLQSRLREIEEHVRALPGVQAASFAFFVFHEGEWSGTITVPGAESHPDEDVVHDVVGDDYFKTLQIPVLAGRVFGPQDTATSPRVTIISAHTARTLFPKGSPLGRHYYFGGPSSKDEYEVVGIAADVKIGDLDEEPVAMDYVPANQHPTFLSDLMVRYTGDSGTVATAVQRAVHEVDRRIPITDVSTLDEWVARSITDQRVIAQLATFFGLLAIFLSAIGIYGLMSYVVSRRTNEIGIRMALGAERRQVRWLVMREILVLVAVGIALGVPAVLASSSIAQHMLFGVSGSNLANLLAASGVMLLIAALAGYLPARRASRVDPMVALRYE
ncbi:MAG TPA: ABC transporter permease [Acidobacteriaceae bacterium]